MDNDKLLQDQIKLQLNYVKEEGTPQFIWTIQKKKLLYVGIALIVSIFIEYYLRDYSKQYTLKLFGTLDGSICPYLDVYEFYSFGGRYLLFFLIMSYVNVYAALTYIFLDCFVVFLNGVIRFFYLDERPFWKHPEYVPCFCATDYGNPSTTGIDLYIMFAVFYKAFTYKSKSKLFNWALLLVCVVNVAFFFVIRMIQNIHYMHQLLYGLAIGYLIYVVMFEVIGIDFDNPRQLMALLENWSVMSLVIVGSFIIVTVVHLNLDLDVLSAEEIGVIELNCKLNSLFSLDKESYSKSTRIFEFLGCFIGCWLEYIVKFNNNKEDFVKYNVVSENDMYRHSNAFISFIRFALLFLTQNYLFSKLILGKANFESFPKMSFYCRLILLQSIPLFIHGLLVFFCMKLLMPYLHLTNESIWEGKKNPKQEGNEDSEKRLLHDE